MIVYGFFHNPMIHESADCMMSLHLTKAGAYKRMREHRVQNYLNHRKLEDGRYHLKGWTRDKEPKWKTWSIRPVEVEE